MSKVLKHPDKELIIKKLLDGESVKSVDEFLKDKYPRKDKYHISYMTLQKFRKEHLDLHGDVLEAIKNARADAKKEEADEEAKTLVAKTKSYQEKINEIADAELDVSRKLREMDALVSARLEYYYDHLATGQGDIKHDTIFLKYLETYKGILQDWKKYIDGVADKTIEHNININVVNEQVNIIKAIVFEVLQEMDPKLVPVFVEKVNQRMLGMEYNSSDYKEIGAIDAEYTAIDANTIDAE
jgi:cysteinyl-tRNA synthetase